MISAQFKGKLANHILPLPKEIDVRKLSDQHVILENWGKKARAVK